MNSFYFKTIVDNVLFIYIELQNYFFFHERQNRKNTYQRHRLQNAPKTSKCAKDARSKPMPLTHNHKRILHAAFDKNHALRNTKQHIYHIKNAHRKKVQISGNTKNTQRQRFF
jgi:hypothetical protein